ncbi:MAG: allantoinase AllB [Thermoanaerobaculia bacterium]
MKNENRNETEHVIRSRRVATVEGVRPATLHIRDERIAAVGAYDESFPSLAVHDVGDAVVMPGIVDSHVHVNEPGRTEWEGFETATRAAAAGGVTTICDMPLNSIPVTTTAAALAIKASAAAGKAMVDYALWGGLIPANAHSPESLDALLAAGVPGCKCFLVHSGIDEFPDVSEADLRAAMPVIARHGAVLLVHAEVPGPIDAAAKAAAAAAAASPGDPRAYATWLSSRPRASENEAIALMLRLSEETGCRVHIVHLSSSDALPMLAAARARGVPVTVETCPHYLTFGSEEIADGRTEFKCAPPIREAENRERLWLGLREGTIDLVVSDHSPCVPGLKALDTGDYVRAWGGISSLQLALPALWTGARARGFALADVIAWMCRGPARLTGLANRKGTLAAGADADLVVWYPEREFSVQPELIRHRHPLTPYAGRVLCGVVEQTYVRGTLVFDGGAFPSPPIGQRLVPNERG